MIIPIGRGSSNFVYAVSADGLALIETCDDQAQFRGYTGRVL